MSIHSFLPEEELYDMSLGVEGTQANIESAKPNGLGLDSLPLYLDFTEFPWLGYNAANTSSCPSPSDTPTSTSSTSQNEPSKSKRKPGTRGKRKDSDDARLNRRREQNRESQQKFRERNRKAYEEVVQALKSERQLTARLKAEVDMLSSSLKAARRDKQTCLEAVSSLCQSMYEFPEAGLNLQTC